MFHLNTYFIYKLVYPRLWKNCPGEEQSQVYQALLYRQLNNSQKGLTGSALTALTDQTPQNLFPASTDNRMSQGRAPAGMGCPSLHEASVVLTGKGFGSGKDKQASLQCLLTKGTDTTSPSYLITQCYLPISRYH